MNKILAALMFWKKKSYRSLTQRDDSLLIYAIYERLDVYGRGRWSEQGYQVDRKNRPIYTVPPEHLVRRHFLLSKWAKDGTAAKIGVRRSATFSSAQAMPFVYEKIDDPVHGAVWKDKTWDAVTRSWV